LDWSAELFETVLAVHAYRVKEAKKAEKRRR
jgi:hypothetical protein